MSPSDWHAGLDALRCALGAAVFHYFTLNQPDAWVSDSLDNQANIGLHSKKLREYEDHYVANDLRMAILSAMPTGQLMLDHEHISAREMSRNAFYADFLGAFGFRNTLGVQVRKEGTAADFLGFLRESDRPQYGEAEKALMNRLMPDLMRAAHLRAHAGQLARQAALGLAALDKLPQGLAVVDASCHMHYGNPAAERLLNGGGLLQCRNGYVYCADATSQAQLKECIQSACRPSGERKASALCLGADGAKLVVTVLVLKETMAAVRSPAPLALLVMADPARPSGLDPTLIGEILGLSPTETRLALLLTTGKTIKDFAMAEGCSWHTARAHLKNLMRKTDCRRQMDVVCLLQSLQLR